MHIRLIHTVFLLFAFSYYAGAQQNDIYTSYDTDDGLPQSSIWNIAQDKQGFLWLGTSDGICRFDGYKFVSYRGSALDSSIGAYVRFYCDSNKDLWVISQSRICFYDRIKDEFIPVSNSREPFSHNYNCFLGESKRYILAGITGYGIVKIDKETHEAQPMEIKLTHSIYTWTCGAVSNDEIWIAGVQFGSYVYNMKTGVLDTLHIPWLSTMINYNDSEMLSVSCRSVALFKKKDHSVRVIPLNYNGEDGNVANILQVSPSQIITASSVGIFYIDTKQWKITKHIKSLTPNEPGTFIYAQSIYKDRSGNIWIGTNGDGLKKFISPYKQFKHYTSGRGKNNLVKSIYVDNKNLYVGYYRMGVDMFSLKDGFTRSVCLNRDSGSKNTVLALGAIDSTNIIYQVGGTNAIGVYQIGRGAKNISPHFMKALQKDKLTNNIYPFFYSAGDTYYTNIGESYLMSFAKAGLKDLRPKLIQHFEGETLSCTYVEADSTIWIGAMSGAFYLKNGILNRVDLKGPVLVKSISQDNDGNIWLATIRGLYVVDRNKKVIQHYTENNGLSNQFVYGILKDDDGNMWFSHNKGLSVYRPALKTFRHYTHEDGLQSNEFNTGAYFKASDGELFFGGINGVNSFYPREIQDNPHVPEVVITSIKLFDMPLKTDTACWNIHTLTLPYTQNSVSFEFAALEFTNPVKNQYAYMMEGVDNTWINSHDRRFARYAALPAGRYVFKVKASNDDGVWQNDPASITIYIVPPFWQLLWFRISVSVVLVGALIGIIMWLQYLKHRKRIRALELQQKIQTERQRISRDLHDTVGTQLSLISINIDGVMHPWKEVTEHEKTEKLQFVNDTARDIIATLRETIWALNKQHITLMEYSDKFKAFVQKQVAIYPAIKLNFNEPAQDGVVLGPSEALNLFRICQEAIANALKYSEATVIDIDVQDSNMKYRISISDNGKGFDLTAVDSLVQNGIENMNYRAQDIDCTLQIDTAPGRGTTIIVTKK